MRLCLRPAIAPGTRRRHYTARSMCGIGGILKVWPAEQRERALATPHVHAIPEAWLDILDDSIKHRGPDGQGRFRDRAVRADDCVVDVAFVHRRLSIIDHAGGHQPMLSLGKGQGVVTGVKRFALGDGLGLYERDAASELLGTSDLGALSASEGHSRTPHGAHAAHDDRVCVVFNGCIYNHRELRTELQRAGHVFSTDHSDTEVLVHGWREWEEGLVQRLEGMFAFIIWDSRGTVFFARDPFGEKPLHTAHYPLEHTWVNAFASTPPSTTRLERVFRESTEPLVPERMSGWLRFGFSDISPTATGGILTAGTVGRYESHNPETCIHALPADGCPVPECWYFGALSHDNEHAVPPRTRRTSVRKVESLLEDAVLSRLEADVDVGCFLSGGVDSSLIAAFAAKRLRGLRTFTIAMPSDAYDESGYAASVARHLGTRHTTLPADARPADDLQKLITQVGIPFGDSSLLPTYWLSRAVRSHTRVALSGDGGDELFCGYERYGALAAINATPRWLARLLASFGRSAPPKSRASKMARAAEARANAGYFDLISIFPTSDLRRLVADPRIIAYDTSSVVRRDLVASPEDAMCSDVFNYLPEDLLRKTDSASMSVALEVRCPFLESRLATTALSTVVSDLAPGGVRKGLLRQVARKYLPTEIVDRPKMGFAIPIGEWFRSDYGGLRTMLLDHLNSAEPFGSPSLGIDLNMTFVKQMLDEHLGTGPSGRVVRDHSQRLYMLLVLSIWAKWLSGLSTGR